MTNGRSKGVVAVFGFQEISDLRHIYRPEIAITLTGSCTHKVLLQAPSPEHATWCEEVIGSEHVVQLAKNTSVTSGTGGQSSRSEGLASSEKTRPLFTKDEFRMLGKPGERMPLRLPPRWLHLIPISSLRQFGQRFYETSLFSPIRGICSVQGRIFADDLRFGDAIRALVPPVGAPFLPRPKRDQFLQTWTRKPAVQPTQSAGKGAASTESPSDPLPQPKPRPTDPPLGRFLWNIVRPNPKPRKAP